MSGGVDSSVAAALLKERGFSVSGAFMKCWSEKNAFGQCSDAEDAEMARQAAVTIGIPFYTFDLTKEYRKHVFDYFISEYKAGRTPNPDVVCNREIKFGIFLKKALALGFNKIATGHYVKIQNAKCKVQNDKSKFKIVYKLLQAKDENKDQSYFLWQLTQEQLRHCLFPLGDYTKLAVREMARKFGLPNAERKDSQGICFVGKVKLVDFLRKYIKEKAGDIVDTTGEILGKHPGIAYFTLGQRRGIGLPGGPFWVVEKRAKDNVLVVSKKVEDLDRKSAIVENINWISGKAPQLPLRCMARIRYQQPLQDARVMNYELGIKNRTRHRKKSIIRNSRFVIRFKKLQRAITPGQSVVFYRGKELLGGGVIES